MAGLLDHLSPRQPMAAAFPIAEVDLSAILGPQPEPRFTAGRRFNQPKPTGPTSKRAKAKAARKQRHSK